MEKPRTGSYQRATLDSIVAADIRGDAGGDFATQWLRIARFLADLLDQRFTIPGTSVRIGLDPILGLLPGFGDLLANLTGSAILLIAAQFNIPKILLLRMGLNIAVNALIGAIPIFGDVFSIWFRSNVKNVQLLERYAGASQRESTASDWLFVIILITALLAVLVAILAGLVWLVGLLFNSIFAGAQPTFVPRASN
jgi:hypothetical protein